MTRTSPRERRRAIAPRPMQTPRDRSATLRSPVIKPGATFHPGVHKTVAAFTNTGTITLDADGDQSAVFVFQIGAAYSSAAGAKVVLTDGALANNVFWQVVGAVSLGAGAELVGTFLGAGAITFGDGASIKGRALTPGTVAVTNSPFAEPIDDFDAPIVTIDGGAARSTNDTTPPISGTADEPAGRHVTVTVAGQLLTATVAAGGGLERSARVHYPQVHTPLKRRSWTRRRTSAPPARS